MNTKKVTFALSAASLVILAGCSSSVDYDFEASALEQKRQVAVAAAYDPANGVLPLPNDLLFNGSEDGTLNIPVTGDATDFSDPIVSLNTLDGWSTSEPAIINFAQSPDSDPVTLIDATSVELGSTVRFFEVETTQGAVTGVVAELDATQVAASVVPTDPTTSANGSSIAIIPVQPLKERTSYMALVTNGLTDDLGRNLARGTVFDVLATVDQTDPQAAGLQTLIRAMLAAGESQGVTPTDVIMAWSFTTQSTTPVLQGLKDAASPREITIGELPLGDTSLLSESSPGAANIFTGSMTVPYYLDAPSDENPAAPLNAMFTNASGTFLTPIDNTPVVKSEVTIPVLMTKPKGTPPEAGFPIAIFQHGITRSRGDMLALADAMALAGYAMIAIDIPVHGITSADESLQVFRQEGNERHFDMDFVNNETSAPGPDGTTDGSGTHFYNLANLVNTRANMRQAIADLFTLSASLGSLADIDTSQKVFIGHSLGAILGTSFLAFDDSVKGASLVTGGGGLSRLLAASPAFGPAIEAGLAGAGVDLNSAAGNSFLNAAQTVVDSADPINHAASAAANTSVHMVQVNGDTVVINNLAGFPLVGTEPLARNMGLATVTETTQGSGFVKVEPGYHSSLLSPAVDANNSLVTITEEQALAVFSELQAQVATFAASGAITIRNPAVIAPTE